MSTPGKRAKGKTASLTAMCGRVRAVRLAAVMGEGCSSVSPAMMRAAILAIGLPMVLATNGTVREARGFTSRMKMVPSWMANWTFIRPPTLSALASAVVWRSSSATVSALSVCTGSEQALSPEWMPASSICSMMPATKVLAVAEAVDVDLDGVGEIGVEEQRVLAEQRVDLAGLVVGVFLLDVLRHQAGHGVEQVGSAACVLGVDDLHGAAAQHIGRAHDQREAELAGDEARLLDRIGDAVLRLGEVELHEKLLEAVAVLGKVDRVGRGAEDRDAGLFQRIGELQRRLAAELDDDAERACRPACSARRISSTSSAVSGSK